LQHIDYKLIIEIMLK